MAHAVETPASQETVFFDEVGFLMDYEAGTLEDEEVVAGFQQLINSGTAHQLQGHYGRMAEALISEGYCHPRPS